MSKKRYRLILESELVELLESQNRLVALENGGVDNWSWYGYSLHDYLKVWAEDNGRDSELHWTFEDIAIDEVTNYELIEREE